MSDTHRVEEPQRAKPVQDTALTTAALASAGDTPAAETRPALNAGSDAQRGSPLFPNDEAVELRAKWDQIQASFVDEPRRAVEQADGLVATAMQRLAQIFAEERGGLEAQWDRGDNVSTEDLRVGLQRYRSFFTRLLSM